MYLVIFLILAFVLYNTITQSGNKSMNLFADKSTVKICPPGQIYDSKSKTCKNFIKTCPTGQVLVGDKCMPKKQSGALQGSPKTCPSGQVYSNKYKMCVNSGANFEILCPPGKVMVGKVCKCTPLSAHPDCVPKKQGAPTTACPDGQVYNTAYRMCTNDPSQDVNFTDMCPPGKVMVGKECKCTPLSAHPDCVPKNI